MDNNKSSQSEDPLSSSAETITKLKKIFEYYCQFGERLNTSIMKSHKYFKLAKDSQILDSAVTPIRLELIYKSENKFNTMSFREFLNSLIKIAHHKFPSTQGKRLNKKQMLNDLITGYFMRLYEIIFPEKNNQSGNLLSNNLNENLNISSMIQVPNVENLIFDKYVEEIITSVAPLLFDIYRVYFPHEISISENIDYVKDSSSKQFFIFLKSFDIMPGLISMPTAFQIFQSEMTSEETETNMNKNKDYYFRLIRKVDVLTMIRYSPKNPNVLGQYFIFFKFLRTLLKIADLGYQKLESGETEPNRNGSRNDNNEGINLTLIPIHEKLILMLEKIELSDGFQNLKKMTNMTHNSKTASMVTRDLLEKIKKDNCLITNLLAQTNNNISVHLGTMCKNNEGKENLSIGKSSYIHLYTEKNMLLYHNNYADLCEHSNYIMESYGQELLVIYKGFCSFGDALNNRYMKSKKFQKFLMEAKLVKIHQEKNMNMNAASSQSFLNNSHGCCSSMTSSRIKLKKNDFGLQMNQTDTIFIKLSNLNNYNDPLKDETNTEIDLLTKSPNYSRCSSGIFPIHSANTIIHNASVGSFASLYDPADCFTSLKLKNKTPINSNATIDFKGFIIGIEIVARFIYPNLPAKEAVDNVIKNNILANLSESYLNKGKFLEVKIEYLKAQQSNSEFIRALELIHKTVTPLFKFYCNMKNALMSFQQFMKFARDFEIFPKMISKTRLNSFFKGISQYSNFADNEDCNELIEQSLFVDILALCSFEMLFMEPEPSPLEKLLFFIEKLLQSDGIEKGIRSSGSMKLNSGDSVHLLDDLRDAFPQYFTVRTPKKKEEFVDIIAGEEME